MSKRMRIGLMSDGYKNNYLMVEVNVIMAENSKKFRL